MTAVAIFVKTPGLSPVKTRLARSLGERRAIALYRQCAAAVLETAQAADIGPVYWALAESAPEAVNHWPAAAGRIRQGSGDLGTRMHRVMQILVGRHQSGLLLGADAPQLDPDQLRRAACWLAESSPRTVIGPARDGGFWTFGANHVPPLDRWRRVAYSRTDTAERFRQSMGDDARWLQLPTLTDLDVAADLPTIRNEFLSLRDPTAAQRQVQELLSPYLDPGT